MNIYLTVLEYNMLLLNFYSIGILSNIIEMENTEAKLQANIFRLEI